MVECDYCDATVSDDDAYLTHLAEAHEGELGAIDRRRVEDHTGGGEESSVPTGPVVLVGVLVVAFGLVAYVLTMGGGGSAAAVQPGDVAQTPGQSGSAHEHGTIDVRIAGERLDFSRREYQVQDRRFHFEGGDGSVWHTHATGVTLEYAMATLGIGVTEASVTYDGTTYTHGDGTNVSVTVNGESVDPASYVLQGAGVSDAQEGDHVEIVVETSG